MIKLNHPISTINETLLKQPDCFSDDYNLSLFQEKNELVKRWFSQHVQGIYAYLQKNNLVIKQDLIQLTGSRAQDAAYPESDIDFAVVTDNPRIFDLICQFYKEYYQIILPELAHTQAIQASNGLSLFIIKNFPALELKEMINNTRIQLEFTLRSPSQHELIQSAASKFFSKMSTEQLKFYNYNLRSLNLQNQLMADKPLKDAIKELKQPLFVLPNHINIEQKLLSPTRVPQSFYHAKNKAKITNQAIEITKQKKCEEGSPRNSYKCS